MNFAAEAREAFCRAGRAAREVVGWLPPDADADVARGAARRCADEAVAACARAAGSGGYADGREGYVKCVALRAEVRRFSENQSSAPADEALAWAVAGFVAMCEAFPAAARAKERLAAAGLSVAGRENLAAALSGVRGLAGVVRAEAELAVEAEVDKLLEEAGRIGARFGENGRLGF